MENPPATVTLLLLLVIAADGRRHICEDEMEKQQNLKNCQAFLERRLWVVEEEVKENLKMCCDELRDTAEQCRCKNLKQALRRLVDEGKVEDYEIPLTFQAADDLPHMCNIKSCHLFG